MDFKVEEFYKSILRDLKVDQDEAQDLVKFFDGLNPPPDKLVWLRAAAFRLGCNYLSHDNEANIALLRTINAIVHSLEKTCMVPKLEDGNTEFDSETVEALYKTIFGDLTVDREENVDLLDFFAKNIPPATSLVAMRAAAFKVAVDFLTDDNNSNISLLRSLNVLVHCFESACLEPKDYNLELLPDFNLDVGLSDAVQHMWNLDANRLTPNVDYTLNVQQGKKPFWKEDKAEDPLFKYVDREALKRPTYRLFLSLLDNYEAQTGVAETVTSNEKEENWAFLKAVMQTAPMQFCHKYLIAKKPDEIPSNPAAFMKLLYDSWFDLYSRGGVRDSSGFEHVFVGEVRNDSISGFHNWINFYMQEQKGNLDFRGYIKPRSKAEAEASSDDHVLTLQFSWNGVEKFVGTSFIGVSPEFEMAVYTTCFFLGEEDNEVVLNTGTDIFHLTMRCHKIAGDKIGTAFPEATGHYD